MANLGVWHLLQCQSLTCEDEECCCNGERSNAELLKETLVCVSLGADGCHKAEHSKTGVNHLPSQYIHSAIVLKDPFSRSVIGNDGNDGIDRYA